MTEQAVLEYIVNSIWQVPVLAIMAWLLVWIGKPTARVQHCIWLMTLALSILLPLLEGRAFTAAPPVEEPATHFAAAEPVQVTKAANDPKVANDDGFIASSGEVAHLPWLGTHTWQLSQSAVNWLLGIYFAIVIFRLIQLAFSWRGARRLVRQSLGKNLSPAQRAILEECCEKLHVREPRMLISSEIASPMTIGGVQPALVLPENFANSTENEIAAILCHELAHVRRRDYLANWVCQLGSLPIAYHPATHGVHRRIRQSRELICDAMAATAMCSATGYARCLVTLAQRILDGERLPQSVQAAGLFDHDVLEERIMRLLERKNTMSLRARILRAGCAMSLTAAVITMAAVFHVTPTVVNAEETNASAVQVGSDARSAAVPAVALAVPAPAAIPMQQAIHTHVIVPVRITTPIRAAVPTRVAAPVHVVLTAPVLARVRVTAPVRVAVRAHVSTPIQIAAVVQATNPAPVPQIDAAPTVHPAPVKPAPVPSIAPAPSEQVQPEANQHGTMVRHRDQVDLTPEQRARMEADMAAAREQIREATKKFQSPEFKKQMADMQRQVAEATSKLQSAEVQRQMKMLQSPEFKKQMADMQRQIKDATKQLQSEEVQRQMKMLQSPEFKKQMADMQSQIQQATQQLRSEEVQRQMKMLQSPEFKKQMADMQRQIKEATKQFNSQSMRLDEKGIQQPEVQPPPMEKKDSTPR